MRIAAYDFWRYLWRMLQLELARCCVAEQPAAIDLRLVAQPELARLCAAERPAAIVFPIVSNGVCRWCAAKRTAANDFWRVLNSAAGATLASSLQPLAFLANAPSWHPFTLFAGPFQNCES